MSPVRIVVYVETVTEHGRIVVNCERRNVPAEAAERTATEIAAEAVKETMRRAAAPAAPGRRE